MRSSHVNCKRCHVRRAHKRAKYEMCPPCRAEYTAELRAQQQAARDKQRTLQYAIIETEVDRVGMGAVLEDFHHTNLRMAMEDTAVLRVKPVTNPLNGRASGRPPARVWTDDERLEIGRRYEQGQTYEQIQSETGANYQIISQVAKSLGLSRTRGPKLAASSPPASPVSPQSGDTPLPEPQMRALENMLTPPPTVLSPKPEPLAQHPDEGWLVRVEGLIGVRAESIEDALAQVKRMHPDLRITGINQAS